MKTGAPIRLMEPGAEVDALERALARAGDGAFVTGDDGCIRSWNRAAEKLLGYASHEVLGRTCRDLFDGCDSDGRHFDLRARTKAGRPIWLNMSVLTTSRSAEERLTVHLFRDVTASKELLAVVHECLGTTNGAAGGGDPAAALSRRERDVLQLMTQGLNTAAIAERLRLSPATVRNHAQSILAKLGVHSRLEAVALATRSRLF
jgi:DNA-binding CsgD family transcriptional regulator